LAYPLVACKTIQTIQPDHAQFIVV